jgi:hypothetical protein
MVLVLLLAAGCGSRGGGSSQQGCDDTRAVLGQFHGLRGSAEEVRTLQIEGMRPKLAELAGSASGNVKTAIQRLADTIEEADLDSGEPVTTLRPKLDRFDTAFDEARQEFDEACD